jgi:O-antigen/teichoic acid export membrane protein
MKKKVVSKLFAWSDRYKKSPILKKTSSILSVDILVRSSGILLLPVYLLLMTQQEYGLYNYIISIVTTFSIILNFGLYVSQSKYYSDADTREKQQQVLFNISLLLTILLALVITPMYVLHLDYALVKVLFKNDIDYESYRWLILLAVVVTVYSLILSNYFIISEKIGLFRNYGIFRLLAVHALVILALYLNHSDSIKTRLLYTYITETVVLLVFFTFYIRDMRAVPDWKWMPQALKLSIPIMFSALWGMLSNYSDKFFLEKYGTARDLSWYYLAFSLSNVLYMICTAVQNAWLPNFLKDKDLKINMANTRKLISRLSIALVVIGVLLVIGLYIAIQVSIISPKYTPALYLLPVLCAAQLLNGISLIYSNYMIYLGKTHWTLYIGIITSIAGVTGSYLIIPLFNIYGAVFVYLGVQVIYLCLYHMVVSRKLKTLLAKAETV